MKKVRLNRANFNMRGVDLQTTKLYIDAANTSSKLFLICSTEAYAESEVFFICISRTTNYVPATYLVSCSRGATVVESRVRVKRLEGQEDKVTFYSKYDNGAFYLYMVLAQYHRFSKSVIMRTVGSPTIPIEVFDDTSHLTLVPITV